MKYGSHQTFINSSRLPPVPNAGKNVTSRQRLTLHLDASRYFGCTTEHTSSRLGPDGLEHRGTAVPAENRPHSPRTSQQQRLTQTLPASHGRFHRQSPDSVKCTGVTARTALPCYVANEVSLRWNMSNCNNSHCATWIAPNV